MTTTAPSIAVRKTASTAIVETKTKTTTAALVITMGAYSSSSFFILDVDT